MITGTATGRRSMGFSRSQPVRVSWCVRIVSGRGHYVRAERGIILRVGSPSDLEVRCLDVVSSIAHGVHLVRRAFPPRPQISTIDSTASSRAPGPSRREVYSNCSGTYSDNTWARLGSPARPVGDSSRRNGQDRQDQGQTGADRPSDTLASRCSSRTRMDLSSSTTSGVQGAVASSGSPATVIKDRRSRAARRHRIRRHPYSSHERAGRRRWNGRERQTLPRRLRADAGPVREVEGRADQRGGRGGHRPGRRRPPTSPTRTSIATPTISTASPPAPKKCGDLPQRLCSTHRCVLRESEAEPAFRQEQDVEERVLGRSAHRFQHSPGPCSGRVLCPGPGPAPSMKHTETSQVRKPLHRVFGRRHGHDSPGSRRESDSAASRFSCRNQI